MPQSAFCVILDVVCRAVIFCVAALLISLLLVPKSVYASCRTEFSSWDLSYLLNASVRGFYPLAYLLISVCAMRRTVCSWMLQMLQRYHPQGQTIWIRTTILALTRAFQFVVGDFSASCFNGKGCHLDVFVPLLQRYFFLGGVACDKSTIALKLMYHFFPSNFLLWQVLHPQVRFFF